MPQRYAFTCSNDPPRESARHGGWASRITGEASRCSARSRLASPTRARLGTTAAVAALTLTAVGCQQGQPHSMPTRTVSPATTAASPRPIPDHTYDAEPVAVAVAFTTALGERSYLDISPTAWLDRAAPFMTLRLSAQLREQAADNGAVADWNALRAAHARISVRVDAATAGTPRTTDSLVVTLTAHYLTTTPGGGRQVSQEQVALVVLRAGDRWLVDRTSQDEP